MVELKGEIDIFIIIVGDFNTQLSIIDQTTRQKISDEMENLHNTTNQPALTDTYRTLYPTTTAIHILLKCTWDIL